MQGGRHTREREGETGGREGAHESRDATAAVPGQGCFRARWGRIRAGHAARHGHRANVVREIAALTQRVREGAVECECCAPRGLLYCVRALLSCVRAHRCSRRYSVSQRAGQASCPSPQRCIAICPGIDGDGSPGSCMSPASRAPADSTVLRWSVSAVILWVLATCADAEARSAVSLTAAAAPGSLLCHIRAEPVRYAHSSVMAGTSVWCVALTAEELHVTMYPAFLPSGERRRQVVSAAAC